MYNACASLHSCNATLKIKFIPFGGIEQKQKPGYNRNKRDSPNKLKFSHIFPFMRVLGVEENNNVIQVKANRKEEPFFRLLKRP